MLSDKMIALLNSGSVDLVLVHGAKADWNPEEEQFENMRGCTVSWGPEKAAALEDKNVRLFLEIEVKSS